MVKTTTNRPKVSPKRKSAKPKKPSPKASEEFGGDVYTGDDWKALKKKHPRGFEGLIEGLQKKEWEDGSSGWYAQLEGHDQLAKINKPSGRALSEVFGDKMDDWVGCRIHVLPTKYGVGWGSEMSPAEDNGEDDEIEDELDESEPDLDEDDYDDEDVD